MRNLILFLTLLFSSTSFTQTLNDFVNFDSLNINLINTEVFKQINDKREFLKSGLLIKDTIPIASAKYHLTYFKQYNELVEEHKYPNGVKTDLYGLGYQVKSHFPLPEDRLLMMEKYVKHPQVLFWDQNYNYITEISHSYNVGLEKITYNKLINMILLDVYLNSKKIFYPYDKQIYFGVWCESINDNNKNVTFAITFVMCEKINENLP